MLINGNMPPGTGLHLGNESQTRLKSQDEASAYAAENYKQFTWWCLIAQVQVIFELPKEPDEPKQVVGETIPGLITSAFT